jgi:hypothetical protein
MGHLLPLRVGCAWAALARGVAVLSAADPPLVIRAAQQSDNDNPGRPAVVVLSARKPAWQQKENPSSGAGQG